MTRTRFSRCRPGLAPALMALACIAGSAHADAPKVSVDWTDPAQLSDVRQSMCMNPRIKPGEWLGELARHLQRRAGKALAPGQHLDVTILDIQRAGICEPWRGPAMSDIRVVNDLYPPRIDLHFTLTAADGRVIGEGTRELRDSAFLHRSQRLGNDPLQYEKRLLDDWLRRELPAPQRD